jgi:hypothetical protein
MKSDFKGFLKCASCQEQQYTGWDAAVFLFALFGFATLIAVIIWGVLQ